MGKAKVSPARKAAAKKAEARAARNSIEGVIKATIEARGISGYELAQLAEIDASILSRFLNGGRGITLETADKIAKALDLRLVEAVKARPKARARKA